MRYLSDQENQSNLEGQLGREDRLNYKELPSTRVEACFDSRLFIVYQVRKDRSPDILTTLKMVDFWITTKEGSIAVVEDLSTGQEMEVGHVPLRMFDYDIYVQIPPVSKVRWDARLDNDSIVRRSLVYPMLIKTRSRSDRFEAGHTYVETPKQFLQRFPNHPLPLRHL